MVTNLEYFRLGAHQADHLLGHALVIISGRDPGRKGLFKAGSGPFCSHRLVESFRRLTPTVRVILIWLIFLQKVHDFGFLSLYLLVQRCFVPTRCFCSCDMLLAESLGLEWDLGALMNRCNVGLLKDLECFALIVNCFILLIEVRQTDGVDETIDEVEVLLLRIQILFLLIERFAELCQLVLTLLMVMNDGEFEKWRWQCDMRSSSD